MPVKSGVILSKTEILTDHGIIEKYKTTFEKGTKVWLFYDISGRLTTVEEKEIIIPIKKRDGDGE